MGNDTLSENLKLTPTPSGPFVVPPKPAFAGDAEIRLSLVIPTFNEAKNIEELISRLCNLLDTPLKGAFELIVVDDDSRDETWRVALEIAKGNPHVRVIRRTDESGLSSAVIRGWQAARGDILGVIDADLQHPPETTLKLWMEVERGAELAAASRHVEGGGVSDWSVLRRMLSRGAQLLGMVILPKIVGRVSDPMSGFFLLRRTSIEGATLKPHGYKILIEVIGRGRINWISEVGYVFQERTEGESKVTWRLYVQYLRHLLTLRIDTLLSSRFLRFSLVGASGVIVDMFFLYCLSDPSMLGFGLTRSKIIAAELAIVNNFLWNDFWTFRDLKTDQRSRKQKLKRFLKFNAICFIGLVLNVVILNVLFNLAGMNRYLANAIAIFLVTLWNFWMNLKFSWRSSERA